MWLPVRVLCLSDVTCERKSRSEPHHRISQDSCNPFPHYEWSLYLVCVLQPLYPRFINGLQYLHKYSWSLKITSYHAYLGITAVSQTCWGRLTRKLVHTTLKPSPDGTHHPPLQQLQGHFPYSSYFLLPVILQLFIPFLLVVTLWISFTFITNS